MKFENKGKWIKQINESSQKTEADSNAERTLLTKISTIKELARRLTKDNLVPQLTSFKKYVDDTCNFALKHFEESTQMTETRGYTVTVELGVPDNMNNRDIEDEVERLLRASNKINVVMDVTAERK